MGHCSDSERRDFGEGLKTAISSFTVDFLPHMKEEEEVRGWRGDGRMNDEMKGRWWEVGD